MTIIFVAAYDEATNANLAIAQNITNSNDILLLGSNAIRDKLHFELTNTFPYHPIFIMSHGELTALIDSDRNYAVQLSDSALFAGKVVFAWACHTGSCLGCYMAKDSATWWGYDCAVTAPSDHLKYEPIFRDIFTFIKNQFSQGTNDEFADLFLELLKIVCESAVDKLDTLSAFDDDDAMSLYTCCNQIWQRLCVWLPNKSAPLKHRDAPPAFINL